MRSSLSFIGLLFSILQITCTADQKPGQIHSHSAPPYPVMTKKTCVVTPSLNGTDDAPAILNAFSECGHGGHIILTNGTFHINTIMNTTGLRDYDIDIHGYMLVSRYCALNDEGVQV
jgi:hypothetical protein